MRVVVNIGHLYHFDSIFISVVNTSFRQMDIMEAVQKCMKSLPESYLLNYHEQLNVRHQFDVRALP